MTEDLRTVSTVSEGYFEQKGSKFISFLMPFKDFESLMINLKFKHPKAVHFVYAYRFFNEFNQIVENLSDDGEPKGTSAKPILKVLQGQNLVNCAFIIVRYFGGTKLGTGGLVKAYTQSANDAILKANFDYFEHLIQTQYSIAYTNLSKFEYEAKQNKIIIIEKIFGNKVEIKTESNEKNIKLFEEKIKDLF